MIGDLDCLPIGDVTQDLAALVSHLAVGDGPHVAQRSTPLNRRGGDHGRASSDGWGAFTPFATTPSSGAPAPVEHGVYRVPLVAPSRLDQYKLATLWPDRRGLISHESALDPHHRHAQQLP
jgi:hypothetical protein